MLVRYIRGAGRLALGAAVAASLAACAAGPQPSTPVGVAQPSAVATSQLIIPTAAPATGAPATATPLPVTAAPATAAPVTATPAPATPPPATATPQPAPLVGPEWTVVTTGDFDGNGAADVLASKASPVIISAPGGFPVSIQASEVVLVERGPDGGPRVRMAINSRAVLADGQPIASFGEANPVGFWVRGGGAVGALTITPLNSLGQQFTQDLLIAYSAEARAYRLFPATGPRPELPTATPPAPYTGPLVGDDWRVLVSGDANNDGAEDVVAYIPAPLTLSGRALGPIYQGYLTAYQAAIVQRGPDGAPVVQVHIVNGVALVNNQPVPGFPTAAGDVAGLLVSLAPDGAVLLVAPVGYDGDVIGNGFAVVWDQAAGAYQVYPQQG